MKDTPPEIRQMQRDIIHAMTDRERALLGVDMIESARKVVTNSIREEHPHLSEREVVAERFERYYKNEFSEEKLKNIKEAILSY
ncbi:MAG: hypothetical protein U5K31_01085 [Balneolaceae bacterium]|nr:hypothetical protein [Balneolaceae bacterium]